MMHMLCGWLAMKNIASAQSAQVIILLLCSGEGCTGRFATSGVSASPGAYSETTMLCALISTAQWLRSVPSSQRCL